MEKCTQLRAALAQVEADGRTIQDLRDETKRCAYFRRADIPQTGRGDAAAATCIFRGDELRRGYSVETGAP